MFITYLSIEWQIIALTATFVGGGFILGLAEIVYNPNNGLTWAVLSLAAAVSFIIGETIFFFLSFITLFCMLLMGRNMITSLIQTHGAFCPFAHFLKVKVHKCMHVVTFRLSIVMLVVVSFYVISVFTLN